MLKRILPLLLTFACGVLLVSLAASIKLMKFDLDDDDPIVHASGQSRTWLFIDDVPAPDYTEQEVRGKGVMHIQRLQALLDADGTVSSIVPFSPVSVHSKSAFTVAAIDAAKRIRFRPATENGRPISLWVTVDYMCGSDFFAHRYLFTCSARIAEVEKDWRTIYE